MAIERRSTPYSKKENADAEALLEPLVKSPIRFVEGNPIGFPDDVEGLQSQLLDEPLQPSGRWFHEADGLLQKRRATTALRPYPNVYLDTYTTLTVTEV